MRVDEKRQRREKQAERHADGKRKKEQREREAEER